MNEPTPGSTSIAELVVGSGDLASALSLETVDNFPDVFATSRMVALMEIAAARLLLPCLESGQLSVGVSLEVMHSAPTPPGAKVVATARYLGREGKLFDFEVIATDPGGEVGRARHKRAIVDTQRLLDKAGQRIPQGN